jgi:ribosomal peptide maturation radical SAM protein 1
MEYLHARTAEDADAATLSVTDYQEVATKDFVVQLGDWIFKVPPYADPSPEDHEYLAFVRSSGFAEKEVENAIRMKQLVPDYLKMVADELLACSPRIVGFSTVFQQNIASLVLAKILKSRDPSLTIVFGGGNCDGPMGATLHGAFPWIDVVVRGEGEMIFPEVAEDILSGRAVRPRPGLCFRADGKSFVIPQQDGPQVEINEIPLPTYDDFFERLAKSPLREELWPEVSVLFESSRGCWWGAKSHCTFCGLNGSTMPFRSKPAARVAEELISLAERYKVLDFVAVDDIIDLRHIRELSPLLASSGFDFQLFYETKANLKKDHLRSLYSAGVMTLQPGIESLSTPILKLMRKGVTALQNIRLLKWCAEIGILPAWNLLYGFPGEPPEEYEKMADLIPSLVHLEPPNFMPLDLDRFSPYFERPAEFGIEITGPQQCYKFLYSLPSETLANIAYAFDFRYPGGREPSTYTSHLREAVERWRQSGPKSFGALSYRRGPGFLIVQDRRPGLETADYRFDGVEAEIYLGCDAGTTPEDLYSQIAKTDDNPPDKEDIAQFLDELVAARLMYREANRVLSLAIAAPTTQNRRNCERSP